MEWDYEKNDPLKPENFTVALTTKPGGNALIKIILHLTSKLTQELLEGMVVHIVLIS